MWALKKSVYELYLIRFMNKLFHSQLVSAADCFDFTYEHILYFLVIIYPKLTSDNYIYSLKVSTLNVYTK